MTEVVKFYILSHSIISLTGAVLLIAIWYNINKRFRQTLQEDNSPSRFDKGLLYLSLAFFVWVVAGSWSYVAHQFNLIHTSYFPIGNSLFSILNDLFIFLALCYADHAPLFIHKNKKNRNRIIVVIILCGVLTLLSPILVGYQPTDVLVVTAIPDLMLSAFLTFLLIVTFYRTFANRGLKVAAVISTIAILFIFVSILPGVFQNLYDDFTKDLIKITARTSFIAVTLVMATSWVIELANTPKPNEMMVSFLDWSLVKLTIPSKKVIGTTVEFGSKTTQYINLLKFAIRRKYGDEASQSMLIGLGGEITNQTYLTRIIENINDILKPAEDQKLERKDLFTFIGQGRYRLRIVPENIRIDPTLLREFVNASENGQYKKIVTPAGNSSSPA